MATYTSISLPLFEDYFYSYSISLDETSTVYVIEIQYNDYAEQWFMSLFTEDQETLLAGIALVPEYPIALDYALGNITGFFWLLPIPEIPSDKYSEEPEALSQYFTFEYVP